MGSTLQPQAMITRNRFRKVSCEREEGGESVLSLYVVYLWLACFTVYNILFAFHLLDAVFPKCLGSELAINDGISPRSRYLSARYW